MKENNILDDIQLTYDFNDHLEEDESIVWSGKPNPGVVISALERTGTSLLYVLIFFFWIILGSTTTSLAVIAISILVSVCLLARPQLMFYINKRKTSYALTNKRLFFKLWSWKGTKIHWLKLDDIEQIPCKELKDKKATLHFIVNNSSEFYGKRQNKPSFITRNIESRKVRKNPTFELVPEALELKEIILEQKKELVLLKNINKTVR